MSISSSSSSSMSSGSSSSLSSSSEIKKTMLTFDFDGTLWNRTKLIRSEMPGITGSRINRLAQSVPVETDSYEIGKVALYLERKLGNNPAIFNITVHLYEANLLGEPSVFITSSALSSDLIRQAGWYALDMPVSSRPAPASKMLCFVVYQDGGDEDNYVSWFYSPVNSPPGYHALYSSDGGSVWKCQPNVIRAIQVMGVADVFSEAYIDSDKHQIRSSPGSQATLKLEGNDYLSSGNFVKTVLQKTSQSVAINNQKLLASVVMDCSGSMGWNDRAKKKVEIASSLISSIRANYPGEVLFDIIRFGGTLGGLPATFSSNRRYNTIKVNLAAPKRTKKNNDNTSPSLSDGVISFGFANLENSHKYIFAGAVAGGVVLDDGQGTIDPNLNVTVPVNYQSIGRLSDPVLFAIKPVGPASRNAVEMTIPATGAKQVRKTLGSGRQFFTTGILKDVLIHDTKIQVSNPSSMPFNTVVDIVDADNISVGHTVVASEALPGGYLTVTPELPVAFGTADKGGIVQQTSTAFALNLMGQTTLDLMLLDAFPTPGRKVTFYIETKKGGRLEWDITPLKDWGGKTWVYTDEPLSLATDASLPSGEDPSKYIVTYAVDELPREWGETALEPIKFEFDPPLSLKAGEDQIPLETVEGIQLDDLVSITSVEGKSYDGFLVSAIDVEAKKITIVPPLYEDIDVASITILPAITPDPSGEVDMLLSAVDVTPMLVKRNIDPSLLLPTDPPPVDPNETNYDAYNEDETRWQHKSFSVPSIEGEALIRIMPVTEDYLKAKSEQVADVKSGSDPYSLTDDERMQMEASEQAYEDLVDVANDLDLKVVPPVKGEAVATSSVESENIVGEDYKLSPRITSLGGKATMTTSTKTLELQDWDSQNLCFDIENAESDGGEILAKDYTIFRMISAKDGYGRDTFRQILKEEKVSFLSPVQIFSKADRITYLRTDCCVEQEKVVVKRDAYCVGAMATSGQGVTIDYVVYYKGALLPSGSLTVTIFDADRKEQEMSTPEAVIPNLAGELKCVRVPIDEECPQGDYTLNESREEYSRVVDNGKSPLDNYSSYAEATYLNGYTKGGIKIDVVNGKASLTIADPRVVAKLIIVAQFAVPRIPNTSVIREDVVRFTNPLRVILNVPFEAESGLDKPPVMASATVLYLGAPVPDNVEVQLNGSEQTGYIDIPGKVDPTSATGEKLQDVKRIYPRVASAIDNLMAPSFQYSATPTKPSISKTKNGTGVADGLLIGPHETVTMRRDKFGEYHGVPESFVAVAAYQGWSAKDISQLTWMGPQDSDDEVFVYVQAYKNGMPVYYSETFAYADGWDSIVFVADLVASDNLAFNGIADVHDSLVGLNAQSAQAALFGSGAMPLPGSDFTYKTVHPVDPTTGSVLGEYPLIGDVSTGWASCMLQRAYIPRGNKDPDVCEDDPQCPAMPWETIPIGGNSKAKNRLGKAVIVRACRKGSPSQCAVPTTQGGKKYAPPLVRWKDPLEGEFYIDGKKTPKDVVRDGVHFSTVAFEVTFSGEPIPFVAMRHDVRGANGLPVGFPTVRFSVYKLQRTYDKYGRLVEEKKMFDPTLTLSEYTPVLALSQTSNAQGHYHDCEVDDSGNGATTKTYVAETRTEMPNHIHSISAYVVEQAFDASGETHAHSLRSVAITRLSPVSGSDEICIEATTSYDASSSRVDRILSKTWCSDYAKEMATDLWKLELFVDKMQFASKDVTVEDSGFNVHAVLSHSTLDPINGRITPLPVPDGIRIQFDLSAFKEKKKNDDSRDGNKTVIVYDDPTVDKKYALLKVKAQAVVDDLILTKEKECRIISKLQWCPQVIPLVPKPTVDDFYLSNALSNISDVVGASQINDAVYMAANRAIQLQNDVPSWKTADKIIFLLSDGCENGSEITLAQAGNRVNEVSGKGMFPVSSFDFCNTAQYGSLHLDDIASATGGYVVKIPLGLPLSQISAKIRALVESPYASLNAGRYINVVDLRAPQLFKASTLWINVPLGATVSFRARFSDDADRWGAWTPTVVLLASQPITLPDQVSRYMQYEIVLRGNWTFQSPEFSGLATVYIKSNTDIIFFQPIYPGMGRNDYVNEVVVEHEANVPDMSSVQYGVCLNDSTNFDDYYSVTQPPVESGRRQIVLSRFNELALSSDGKTYTLVNGRWPTGATVDVYLLESEHDISGKLADPSTYVANPSMGTITFHSARPKGSRISASIGVKGLMRMACKITNRSEEIATIDHIGVSYNVTKRVETDNFGTIIRQPIDGLLDESSSSSLLSLIDESSSSASS